MYLKMHFVASAIIFSSMITSAADTDELRETHGYTSVRMMKDQRSDDACPRRVMSAHNDKNEEKILKCASGKARDWAEGWSKMGEQLKNVEPQYIDYYETKGGDSFTIDSTNEVTNFLDVNLLYCTMLFSNITMLILQKS